jgi:hypothetical protein
MANFNGSSSAACSITMRVSSTRGDAQFAEDLTEVMRDGVGADVRASCDLIVVQSLGDNAGDGLLGVGVAVPAHGRPRAGTCTPVAAPDAEVAEPPADACLVPAGAHLPVLRECRRPHQAGSSHPGPFGQMSLCMVPLRARLARAASGFRLPGRPPALHRRRSAACLWRSPPGMHPAVPAPDICEPKPGQDLGQQACHLPVLPDSGRAPPATPRRIPS